VKSERRKLEEQKGDNKGERTEEKRGKNKGKIAILDLLI